MASALSDVADTMAAMASCPASRTRQTRSSAFRPCAPATASVPKTSLRPRVRAAMRTTLTAVGNARPLAAEAAAVVFAVASDFRPVFGEIRDTYAHIRGECLSLL